MCTSDPRSKISRSALVPEPLSPVRFLFGVDLDRDQAKQGRRVGLPSMGSGLPRGVEVSFSFFSKGLDSF